VWANNNLQARTEKSSQKTKKRIDNAKMKIKRGHYIYPTLILSLLILVLSCKRGDINEIKDENFTSFYQRFHSDSAFQMKRIIFPLPGVNTDDMTVDDSIYYWNVEKWEVHKFPNIKANDFKVDNMMSENTVVEKIYKDDSGFFIERKFELLNCKWILTYYANINL
jgi:hypothetical protein